MADDNRTAANIAQVVAPVTAVVAVFTSLAVTGVLGQAQRDEGSWLIAAFACIVGGAVAWLVALLIPAPADAPQARMSRFGKWIREPGERFPKLANALWWLRVRGGTILQMLGVAAVGAGIVLGVVGLVKTQQGFQRPAVSASFSKDSSILTAKVTDQGLATGRRLAVLVQGLQEKRQKEKLRLVADPKLLYFAVIGPDENGKINHSVSVHVPKSYGLVGVKAWSGETDPGCTIFDEGVVRSGVRTGEEAGCLALRLPAR